MSIATIELIAGIFGLLAVVFYIASLVPGIVRDVFLGLRKQKINLFLTKNRKEIGLVSWMFALGHGTLLVYTRQLNLLNPQVAMHFFQGIAMMTILTILAATSNQWSVKNLKSNWKKLHRLTYLVLPIIPWHVLDKKLGHWSFITPIALTLSFVTLAIMLYRLYKVMNSTTAAKTMGRTVKI